MSGRVAGKKALVTGAAQGLGAAQAMMLARHGAQVLLADINAAGAQAQAEAINAELGAGTAHAVALDVTREDQWIAAIDAASELMGGLSVLVNNAGVGGSAPLAETSDEHWERVVATNLSAPFRLTRAALPHLTRGGGHVVMISSLAGRNAIAGMSAYCASKAALDHLAACLMLEVRDKGVKVSVIAPGSVDTSFGGGPRGDTSWMLRAEDVAQTALDLLRMRDGAHSSRVEMRPARPQKR